MCICILIKIGLKDNIFELDYNSKMVKIYSLDENLDFVIVLVLGQIIYFI